MLGCETENKAEEKVSLDTDVCSNLTDSYHWSESFKCIPGSQVCSAKNQTFSVKLRQYLTYSVFDRISLHPYKEPVQYSVMTGCQVFGLWCKLTSGKQSWSLSTKHTLEKAPNMIDRKKTGSRHFCFLCIFLIYSFLIFFSQAFNSHRAHNSFC